MKKKFTMIMALALACASVLTGCGKSDFDFESNDLSAYITLPTDTAERNYADGLTLKGEPTEEDINDKIAEALKKHAEEVELDESATVEDGDDLVIDYVGKYKEDGKTVEGFLTADNCIVDRKSKSGWVQGNAHMDWDGTSIKGRGIYFSFGREFIKIFSQTEIRTKSLKLGSGKDILKQ